MKMNVSINSFENDHMTNNVTKAVSVNINLNKIKKFWSKVMNVFRMLRLCGIISLVRLLNKIESIVFLLEPDDALPQLWRSSIL